VRTYVRIYYLVWLTGLGALLYVASLPAAALADVSITQDEDEKVRSKYIDYGPPGEHELGAKKEDDTIQQRESVLAEKSRGKRPDKYKDNANRQDLSSQLNKVEGKPLDSWLLGTKRDQRKEVREKVSEDKDKKKRLSRDLRNRRAKKAGAGQVEENSAEMRAAARKKQRARRGNARRTRSARGESRRERRGLRGSSEQQPQEQKPTAGIDRF